MDAVIKLRQVSLNYPLFSQAKGPEKLPFRSVAASHVVLDHLNLELFSGARVALVGRNGSGKTSLLRVMGGIFQPSSGLVEVSGSIATFIDNGFGLDYHASGYQNAITRGLLRGLSLRTSRQHAISVGDFTELGSFFHQPVRTYSLGMVSRLVFAMSTEWNSNIILLDEGLGAADTEFQKKAEKRLSDFMSASQILVLASHSKNLITKFCSRGALLKNGRLFLYDNLDSLFDHYPL